MSAGSGEVLFVGSDSKGRAALYLMRPDGSRRRPLWKAPRNAGIEVPQWAPDGGRIAFAITHQAKQFVSDVYVLDVATRRAHRLTTGGDAYGPAWAPNGSRIAFSKEVPAPEDEWQRRELWTMNPDGSDPRQLTQNGWDQSPAWSPDGSRITYTKFSFDKQTSTFHQALYVMPSAGGAARLVSSDSGQAAWSPDGSRLAVVDQRDHNGDFCYDECTIYAELYVMNADGSNPVRLTRTKADEQAPSWSPDGTHILFSSRLNYPPTGSDEIYAIASSGGCPLRLTNDSANVGFPVWRPATGIGPAPRAGPCRNGYRSTGRKVAFHTDLRPARRYHRFPLYWMGRSFEGLLLTNAYASNSGRISIFDLAYDDCGRNPGRCAPSVNLQVEPTCQSIALRDGGDSKFARDYVERVRGALVHTRSGLEGAEGTIFTGGVAVRVYQASRSRVRAIARHLRRFGHRRTSKPLPAPRLPSKLVSRTKRVERALARWHSIRATARRLRLSSAVVRFRLRLAALLPRTRTVKCRRIFNQ